MTTMLQQARYGTEMMEMIWEASEGGMEINFGSFYPACEKLVNRGLIAKTEAPHPNDTQKERGEHRRKYYMLTESGREALDKIYKFRSMLRNMDGGQQQALT